MSTAADIRTGVPTEGRLLDFIVFGVPRSGTTAMGVYLNNTRDLCCFSELFREDLDHADITLPAALHEIADAQTGPANKVKQAVHWLERYETEVAGKTVGNKMPRYYLYVGRVLDALASGGTPARAICCLRDIEGVMASYNARAEKGTEWDAGWTGVYAAAEQIVLLKALRANRHRDILVMSQTALRDQPAAAVTTAVSFLTGGAGKPPDAARIKRVRDDSALRAPRPDTLNPQEQELMAAIETPAIAAAATALAPFHVRDMPADLESEIAALPSDVLSFVKPLVDASAHPPTRDFWPMFRTAMCAGELNPSAL